MTGPATSIPRPIQTLHVEVIQDELCLYDWSTQRVHALNSPATLVWQLCDGVRTTDDIAEALRPTFGDAAERVVSTAVASFASSGLIESVPVVADDGLSRRALLTHLGLTAAMVPLVTSIVAPSKVQAQSGTSQTFNFTGAAQSFVVPAGVTRITVDAFGAAAGQATSGASPGLGGRVTASLPVTSGETLDVVVGGVGSSNFTGCGAGGFNGGGRGNSALGGAGGGGASDVRRAGTKLLIAGGGGGGGRGKAPNPTVPAGGAGGGLVANSGLAEAGGAQGGFGGSQLLGGPGGAGAAGGDAGGNGSAGQGGSGGGGDVVSGGCGAGTFAAGGGGGGGFFGGGAGGGNTSSTLAAAGGGGGSSYTDPSATGVAHVIGVRSGSGQIIITW